MKKETLEKDAHKMLVDYGIKSMGQTIGVLKVKEIMVNFAKWQQEQDKKMYSEEDVRGMLEDMSRYVSTKEMRDNVVDVGYSEWVRKRDWFVNHLIKQFKNK